MDPQKNKEPLHAIEADRSKWTVHSNHNIKCFTENEIKRITDNYKTILGRGGFGVVFKGVLEDKSMVAVKRFIHNVKEDFDKEMIVHREINHRNVVRLIGYCVQENALMMVTEFIPNGNLAGILHHGNTPIPLDVRIGIATQCAEALTYMHSYMYTRVIHGDIKPDNILLDANLNAKISDFGISRLVNTDKTLYTSHIVGSIGYMDPLFAWDGCLTSKSDVYSFGVVLLELLIRKNATKKVGTDTEGRSLVDMFSEAHKTGMIKDVRKFFDPELDCSRNKNILDEVGKLAAECLVMNREKRPDMKHLVERLGKSMKASIRRKQSVEFLYWARKSNPAPVNIIPAASAPAPCRLFSYGEIAVATSNFDTEHLLGQCGFGAFYRGVINDGATMVAVERLWYQHGYHDDLDSFLSYVESRSKLRHINIVPLIGYYCDVGRILVYNYMDQGSLDGHPFGTPSRLTWKQRLEICIGAARGLHYLHTTGATLHRYLTPENILLDKDLVAKISGNQMTDPCYLTRMMLGPNARDLEIGFTHLLTERTDVYYFGAVLLEVLSAQRRHQLIKSRGDLKGWALRCMMDFNLIDSNIKGTINPECLKKFIEIASKCVSDNGIDRPSMEDVVSDLESALRLQLQLQ